jgi:Na+-driven multidrug efflux pump
VNAPPSAREPGLLALAAPLVVSFTLRSLLTSIDIPYTAWLDEPDAALAAIGLFFPLEFAFIACWVGSSSALTSHLSRALGEKNEPRLRQLLGASARLLVALMVAFLVLAAATWALAPRLGLDPAVVRAFRVYAPIVLAGNALFGLWSVLPDSLVKAHHDTRTTMISGLVSGSLNLALNTLFVPVLGLGLPGLALATCLARLGGLTWATVAVRRLERSRRAAWAREPAPLPDLSPRDRLAAQLLPEPYRALLVLAVPSTLTYVLVASESVIVNAALSRLPEATPSIAAYALYQRASMLLSMPLVALSVAVLPYVSRRVGEGRAREVGPALRRGVVAGYTYVLLVATPLCLLGGEALARALGRAAATEALAGAAIQWATPLGLCAVIPFTLARPTIEALQRGTPGLLLAFLRYALLAAPLALGGIAAARALGREPFLGLVGGLIAGSAATSLVGAVWLRRALATLLPRA